MISAQTVTLALTGASGMPYAIRLLECLLGAGREVYLLHSQAARVVARQEIGWELPGESVELESQLRERFKQLPGKLRAFGREEWFAPIASGTNAPHAMVVCPCTMGTLAAIANGMSDNLIERAADVALKEQRKLILVPRETPFSAIHLENMLKLARLGVVILPANPGFYHHPDSVQDLVDFIVARILDHIGVPHRLTARWGETNQGANTGAD